MERLNARIRMLKARLEACSKNASFRPEIVKELRMLEWAKKKLEAIL